MLARPAAVQPRSAVCISVVWGLGMLLPVRGGFGVQVSQNNRCPTGVGGLPGRVGGSGLGAAPTLSLSWGAGMLRDAQGCSGLLALLAGDQTVMRRWSNEGRGVPGAAPGLRGRGAKRRGSGVSYEGGGFPPVSPGGSVASRGAHGGVVTPRAGVVLLTFPSSPFRRLRRRPHHG